MNIVAYEKKLLQCLEALAYRALQLSPEDRSWGRLWLFAKKAQITEDWSASLKHVSIENYKIASHVSPTSLLDNYSS